MADVRRKAVDQFHDWANLVLAFLLFISPWALNYTFHSAGSWNAWIGGIIVAILAILALVRFAEWEEWVTAILGLWLLISPWVLGFSGVAAATWTHVILGILIAAFALWKAWSVRQGTTRATT